MAIPACLLLILFSASWLLLANSGEFLPTSAIAEKQIKNGGIYNSALQQITFNYKLELYKRIKPETVALGSSRVLQFRQESFRQKFLNMGGISGLDELELQVNEMIALGKPKTALLGIDFWWFNDGYTEPFLLPHSNRQLDRIRPDIGLLAKPFIWLATGQASPADLVKLATQKTPHIGVFSRLRNDGFSADGSYAYTSIINGAKPSEDQKFADTLSRIAKKDKLFSPAKEISEIRWKRFIEILHILEDNNIKIILLMPPFPEPVLQALSKNDGFEYIDSLRARLHQEYPNFHDFYDPATLQASRCEFIDGLHGGPVIYLRIANILAKKYPDIFQRVPFTTGHASMSDNEVDFLKLECKK